jgi:hypothetical protein
MERNLPDVEPGLFQKRRYFAAEIAERPEEDNA